MRSAAPRVTADLSGDRLPLLVWIVVATYFGSLVPIRLATIPELRPENRQTATVLVLVILAAQCLLVIRGTHRLRLGYAVGLLIVVAIITYLPLALTGEWWLPMAASLAGAVLLLLRPPVSWVLFLVVVALEVVVRSVLDQPFYMVSYGVTATATLGLSTYGLAWLATLAREMHATRAQHAEAAATRERLESTGSLRETLVTSLARIGDAGHQALASLVTAPARATTEIEELTRVARRALSDVRAAAAGHREPFPSATRGRHSQATRIAWLLIVAFSVTYPAHMVSLVGVVKGTSWDSLVPAAMIAACVAALMVRHASTVVRGVRPKGWPVTLTLQALLTIVPFYLAGQPWMTTGTLLIGAVLLLVRTPWSWVLAVAVWAFMYLAPVLFTDVEPDVYWLVATAHPALVFFGAVWLAELAGRLDAARHRLVVTAVLNERIRLSRDVHDLLGLGLSTITMKAELAVRLVDTDPGRARQELTELVELTARSLSEARSVTSDAEQAMTLDEEAVEARAALTAAGADVRLELADAPLPPALDKTLAVVLRESVTNILRHSTPVQCTIETTINDGVLWLRVDNDGVLEPPHEGGGAGLANMAARAEAVGGQLTAGLNGDGHFILRAELPAEG